MGLNSRQAKGRDLEQRIASYLSQAGYSVATNLVLTGRSGAGHELDVVADKSDGLTSFRLVVECKAWASPIDKEIVYKLAAVLADLGAAKGIIAARGGWTLQASQAAQQANIELWGPEELSSRLGNVVSNGQHTGRASVQATGIRPELPQDQALPRLTGLVRSGLFGRSETMAWFAPLWLPIWSVQLSLTHIEGTFRKVPRVRYQWNYYEGISSTFIGGSGQPLALGPVDISVGYLEPAMDAGTMGKAIKRELQQWSQVTTRAAEERHAAALRRMGINVGTVHTAGVEGVSLAYMPVWVALLQKSTGERIVAVDGVTGVVQGDIAEVLTAHAHMVQQAVQPRRPT